MELDKRRSVLKWRHNVKAYLKAVPFHFQEEEIAQSVYLIGNGLEVREFMLQSSAKAINVSLLQNFRAGSEVNPAIFSMGTAESVHEGKAAVAGG